MIARTGGLRHRTSGVGTGRQPLRLDFDIDARLMAVDLQEHVTDAQGRALAMGDDDRDLFHAGHYRGSISNAAAGYYVRVECVTSYR